MGIDENQSMPHKATLDGLRFLAFLAVFVYHARPASCPWGWAGVNLFFSLSGFLITRILLRGESGRVGLDLRRYYIRRTLRIFPLYYAIILLVGTSGPPEDLPWLFTYTYNIKAFLTTSLNDQLGHFWTLCVEEQFYLLYPIALLFTPARFRLPLVLALIAGSKVFQDHAWATMRMPWARFLLPYCGEDLLWGSLAGMIELRTRPGKHEGTAAFLSGLPLLVLGWNLHEHRLPLPPRWQDLAATSTLAIGCSLIVFGAWRSTSPIIVRALSAAPVAYLGRISYGLYAFHIPVLHGGWLYWIPYAFLVPKSYGSLAMTIAIAAASWHGFEGPINRLKDRMTGPPVMPPA